MDGYTRVLIWVFPVLGRDGVLLLGHGLACVKVALLENHCGVAEYEVHGAVNVALAEELTVGVNIARVLEPQDVAAEHHRVIRSDTERHRLVLRRSGIVLERDVTCNEPRTTSSYRIGQ